MMRGQFFLAGALILVLMFYVGMVPLLSPSYSGPEIRDVISDLFDNAEREYPKAFNIGMNSSGAAETLANFTAFIKNAAVGRSASMHVLWVVTENMSGDLNLTVGNFLGYAANVTLNVSGDVRTLGVQDGGTESAVFASPPSEFGLVLNFNTTENNVLLEKYKANLYAVLEIRKGDDRVMGEIKA